MNFEKKVPHLYIGKSNVFWYKLYIKTYDKARFQPNIDYACIFFRKYFLYLENKTCVTELQNLQFGNYRLTKCIKLEEFNKLQVVYTSDEENLANKTKLLEILKKYFFKFDITQNFADFYKNKFILSFIINNMVGLKNCCFELTA